MPVTVEIKAGKRGQKDADKVRFPHTFATNGEATIALANKQAPVGFKSYKEYHECARAHKRVLLQAEKRPGGASNADGFDADEFDD